MKKTITAIILYMLFTSITYSAKTTTQTKPQNTKIITRKTQEIIFQGKKYTEINKNEYYDGTIIEKQFIDKTTANKNTLKAFMIYSSPTMDNVSELEDLAWIFFSNNFYEEEGQKLLEEPRVEIINENELAFITIIDDTESITHAIQYYKQKGEKIYVYKNLNILTKNTKNKAVVNKWINDFKAEEKEIIKNLKTIEFNDKK